ncbi:hypothetical protein V8G54_000003 (mitochondrion) [Vigna mungo]|uniref:NADH-quinone oxidoreductase subunit D domain-containing protein n=1 Tax=Vigna mungo TaxID=3915 RepID=A0AAQ3SDZ5_VIGMU
MFASGNCFSGKLMNASKMHLLLLVPPRTVEQMSIPNLHRGIDGDSQISQNRMGYDQIEYNRNKDKGNELSTLLNGQSKPFHSELQISESIQSPQVGFEPTTSQLTADRSTTELLRNNGKFDLIEFNSRSQPMTNRNSKFPSRNREENSSNNWVYYGTAHNVHVYLLCAFAFSIGQYGPHHPSMHGVLRLIVTLDGEDVIDCEPILATMFTEAITVNGPEQLGNIQVPKEPAISDRIASHLLWLGPFMADIGAQTPFFYIFREREFIYDLFEAATVDVKEVINWGLSGPMLRASGIQWDLRFGRLPGGPYENLEIRCFDREKEPEWNEFEDFSNRGSKWFSLEMENSSARFYKFAILPQLVKRMKLADIMTILGSIDIIMGEKEKYLQGYNSVLDLNTPVLLEFFKL